MTRYMRSVASLQPQRWESKVSVWAWLRVTLLVVGGLAAFAQAHAQTFFLGRQTPTEYVFDIPMPADFAEMVTATGQKYRAFTDFIKISNQTINGKPQLFMINEVGWDANKIDQGSIAFARNGSVSDSKWWFKMDENSPQWRAVANEIKAHATPRGNWWYAKLQILAAADANQPPVRAAIPQTILIQKRMTELSKQTTPGMFYPAVQIPANLNAFQQQMLAYGNVGRMDPNFRKDNGAKTATDLSGATVQTLGGIEKVFKQNPNPPYFSDSKLNDKLNLAAQFQAEYIASTNVMSHAGPSRSFTDPRTGKRGNMNDLGMRVEFFAAPRSVVEAAGGGAPDGYPHGWMSGDTHFRPWFSVDGIYPELGYGAARSADGRWYFVAVAVRHPDGKIPEASNNPSAALPPANPEPPRQIAAPASPELPRQIAAPSNPQPMRSVAPPVNPVPSRPAAIPDASQAPVRTIQPNGDVGNRTAAMSGTVKYQDRIKPGDKLLEGERLVSAGGRVQLRGTDDGNFVIEDVQTGRVFYTFPLTGPINNPPKVSVFSYNPDGNICIASKQIKGYCATNGRDAMAPVILNKSVYAQIVDQGQLLLINSKDEIIWQSTPRFR